MEIKTTPMETMVTPDGKGGVNCWIKVPNEEYDKVCEEMSRQSCTVREVTPEEIRRFVAATPADTINKTFLSIRAKEPVGDTADQVAEEAAELVQAVIKFKRAAGLSAGTVMDINHALSDIVEEYADAVGCMETLRHALEHNGYVQADGKFDERVEQWKVYKRARALMRYYGYGREFIDELQEQQDADA